MCRPSEPKPHLDIGERFKCSGLGEGSAFIGTTCGGMTGGGGGKPSFPTSSLDEAMLPEC